MQFLPVCAPFPEFRRKRRRLQVEQVLFKPGVEYVEFLSFWRVVAVVWHACGGEHGTSFTDELETSPGRLGWMFWTRVVWVALLMRLAKSDFASSVLGPCFGRFSLPPFFGSR